MGGNGSNGDYSGKFGCWLADRQSKNLYNIYYLVLYYKKEKA